MRLDRAVAAAAIAAVLVATTPFSPPARAQGSAGTPGPTVTPAGLPVTPPPGTGGMMMNAGPQPMQGIPTPEVSLPPASTPTNVPYPAFGTPVPGNPYGVPAPGIPQVIGLQDAINIAVALSPALASARANTGIAAAQARITNAASKPKLAGSTSDGYTHVQPGGSTLGGTSGGQSAALASAGSADRYSNQFTVALSQLIFDGGQTRNAVIAATLNETAYADTYRRELQTLGYNVATAYYKQLNDQRQTAAAFATLQVANTNLALTIAQVRAGTAAPASSASFEATAAQARLSVVQLQGIELQDEAAFANVLGLDANTYVLPRDDINLSATSATASTVQLMPYARALSEAYLMRPDLAANEASVASAQATLKSKAEGRSPVISGTASQNLTSADNSGGSFRNSSQILIGVSIPIYDQGLTAANTALAQAQLDLALATLTTTQQVIQLNVKQGLAGLVSSRAALDQVQAEFNAALTNLRLNQAQYRVGVSTIPALLQAQQQYTQALVDQVNAVYNLRTAEQTYLYALGQNVTNYGPPPVPGYYKSIPPRAPVKGIAAPPNVLPNPSPKPKPFSTTLPPTPRPTYNP